MGSIKFPTQKHKAKKEKIIYPKIKRLSSDAEIGHESGRLLAGKNLTKGQPGKDKALIFRDFENVFNTEFELDTLVAAKRRLSTFKCSK